MGIDRMVLLELIVVGIAISIGAMEQDAAVTVNIESFEEIMTKRLSRLESQMASYHPTLDIRASNNICSLNTRMIEIENVISALQGSKTSFFNFPNSTSSDAITRDELNIKLATLWESLEEVKSRITDLEHQLKGNTQSASPASAKDHRVCNVTQFEKLGLTSHLLRVNTNIFLNKMANASSSYNHNPGNRVMNAIDGDFVTHFHSKIETNPWLFVDLGSTHFIMEVRVSIREPARLAKMKLYAADDAPFFRNGTLTTALAQQFDDSMLTPDPKTVVFRTRSGVCARYILLLRNIANEYLIVKEIQGTGYVLH